MKKYILIVLLIATLAVGYFVGARDKQTLTPIDNIALLQDQDIQTDLSANNNNVIPLAYTISNVPFTSQAPDANWDKLHDEACEEASLIIAKYYLENKTLTKDLAEQEIQAQVAWEINYFGSHKNLTAAETVTLAQKFYNLNNLSTKNISNIGDIKKEISQGHLLITPTAGRLLGNPNFRNPGPVYHMLVISGYTIDKFITQDVGTRNGQNYIYSQEVLFNAIHDWTGTDATIAGGVKNIITVGSGTVN